MNEYEARRLEKIKRNQALIRDLGIGHKRGDGGKAKSTSSQQPPRKRQKVDIQPSRVSARIASTASRPSYNEDELTKSIPQETRRVRQQQIPKKKSAANTQLESAAPPGNTPVLTADVAALRASWSSWTPAAPPPTRNDTTKAFHFASHPSFTPNKSPAEMLQEGCFGGSYFRPLYSRTLGTTIEDDWRELPAEWIEGLQVGRYVAGTVYDPEVNKFKVSCGQSIEEWEAAGWIDHRHDVRGWFQWYCRFFMGRRCDDDDRQVSRWRKCVGERGRWRRMLLRKYVSLGVRDCFDDGEEGDDAPEVSPVMHQTCHHWAFEVRQDVLDEFWRTGN